MAQSHTLMEDIPLADTWAAGNLSKSGYRADHSLLSLKDIERFMTENEALFQGNGGPIIFALGCYVGETMLSLYGGTWQTDDTDPQGEINIAVKIGSKTYWPVQRVMKRIQQGAENDLYEYVRLADPKAL